MKLNIDLKSLLAGLAIGVAAMLTIGAAEGESHKSGRYTCSAGADLLLIVDSTTGQAWAIRPAGVSISGAPPGFFDKKSDR
jgi:hypothetical protein